MIGALLGALVMVACAQSLPQGGAETRAFLLRRNDLRSGIGTNLNWVYDGDGLHLSDPAQPAGATDSLLRALSYTMVRIPGGTLARNFDWQAAVDAPRGTGTDFVGREQRIATGLPEFKRFAVRYHLGILYIVNVNDAPEKVVELIARWERLDPVGAAPIRHVELGNEDYLDDGGESGARRYAEQATPIISALRAAYPGIRIGAQLGTVREENWNRVARALLGESIDFWTWHRYVPYSTYDSVASYQLTLRALADLDSELVHEPAIQAGRPPIWLTEFNLMFLSRGTYQNIKLQPRYYLLLGSYLYLAVKHGLPAAFKCCLANPSWHGLVDVDSASTVAVGLTLSGQATAFFNRWVVSQDSVGIVAGPGQDGLRRTLLVGSDSTGGLSFLIQNNEATSQAVDLPAPAGYQLGSGESLFQQGAGFAADQPRVVATGSRVAATVSPYSVTVVHFNRVR